MPSIVTSLPQRPAARSTVRGKGHSLSHECHDAKGVAHRQRLALGSVRGVFYLDAVCPHCGAHFVWLEDETPHADGTPPR